MIVEIFEREIGGRNISKWKKFSLARKVALMHYVRAMISQIELSGFRLLDSPRTHVSRVDAVLLLPAAVGPEFRVVRVSLVRAHPYSLLIDVCVYALITVTHRSVDLKSLHV